MAGCGREFNGKHEVEGASLRCGTHLYWRVEGAKTTDKNRTQEVILCPLCEGK